jgi:hypothetical protein
MSMRLKLLLVAAASAGLAACGTEEADGPLQPTGPFGRVRFVHAVPDASVGAVNATLEGLPLAAGLAYGAGTPYQPVYAGPRTIVVKRTVDTAATVLNVPFDVGASVVNTVYAAGRAATAASFITTDTITIQPTDSARVRVVHVSPGAGNVDVYVTPTTASIAALAPTAAGVSFRSVTRYRNVPSGRFRVWVTAPGTKTVLVSDSLTAANAVATGSIRTVLVLDRAGGGVPPILRFLTDR